MGLYVLKGRTGTGRQVRGDLFHLFLYKK